MNRFWSFRIFKVFGIPLELHMTFLLLCIYMAADGWFKGGWLLAVWNTALILTIFLCVVLHELGHALTARSFGIHTHRILLLPIGGMAQFDSIPREATKELLITLAGPAVNFIIYGSMGLFLGYQLPEIGRQPNLLNFINMIMIFNLIMGIFNLAPVFPMDGGRILRAILAYKLTYLNATRVAAVYIAKPIALGMIVFALIDFEHRFMMAILFGFIYLGGEMEYNYVRRKEAFRDLRVGDVTRKRVHRISMDSSIEQVADYFNEHNPAEILVFDDLQVAGVILPEAMKKRVIKRKQNPEMKEIMLPVTFDLQADCPLELVGDSILLKRKCPVFPVYSETEFYGVLDAREIDDRLFWQHYIRKTREKKAAESSPTNQTEPE